MTAPAQRRIRILAVSTLAALGGAVLCLWLELAFPNFGSVWFSSHSSFNFYIAPQAWLLVLLAPTAVALAFATCISSLNQSRRARQSFWIGAFTVVLLLLLLGPTYLICGVFAGWTVYSSSLHSLLPENQDAVWFIAECSAAVLGLTAICALLYAWRASSPDAPLQGKS